MVVHGRDGWELAEFDWDEKTGLGTFTYERPKTQETTVIVRAQPHATTHTGWYTRCDR